MCSACRLLEGDTISTEPPKPSNLQNRSASGYLLLEEFIILINIKQMLYDVYISVTGCIGIVVHVFN